MSPDLLYQIALTLIPQVGPVCARQLIDYFGEARKVFQTSPDRLRHIEGLGEVRIQAIRSFRNMQLAEAELKFIEQNKITPLFIRHPDYPRRLLNCADAPILLYKKGDAALNNSRAVAIIGTRLNTSYGKQLTEQFVNDLAAENVLVVSGLAFGVDALAHRAAVRNSLQTVGVLAHGLNQLYPPQHKSLATEILETGGALLTEFISHTQPDRHNFPARNRIVAGMVDAVIVVETGDRGGSLITAELANGYNRDVFAFPGRINDLKSAGCNELIRQNKAVLIRHASDLLEFMNWRPHSSTRRRLQQELFVELSEHEQKLVSLLQEKETLGIDELNWQSGISASSVAAAILSLELKNVIVSLPGKIYRLA